jgi:hypothetical protein
MKKFIFFVLFVCFSSAVYAQSSKSLGLNTSYSFADSKNIGFPATYQSPRVGLVYDYSINEKHGIVTELGVHLTESNFSTLSMCPTHYDLRDYNLNYSLHHIFKHNQFFVKSGFNVQVFDFVKIVRSSKTIQDVFDYDELILGSKETTMKLEHMKFVPEFHFALGRDFDLGKINIRVNGFVERAFILDDYIDYGFSTGVFYQFSK